MSDLVARLRWSGQDAMTKHLSLGMATLHAEAADEIERLRVVLRQIADRYPCQTPFDMSQMAAEAIGYRIPQFGPAD